MGTLKVFDSEIFDHFLGFQKRPQIKPGDISYYLLSTYRNVRIIQTMLPTFKVFILIKLGEFCEGI